MLSNDLTVSILIVVPKLNVIRMAYLVPLVGVDVPVNKLNILRKLGLLHHEFIYKI